MRNQYKILAEKYSLVKENDKEDIMAGLDYLTSLHLPKIYTAYIQICRGELNDDYQTISVVDSDYIQDTFYGEDEVYFQGFTSPWLSFEELINNIKKNQLVEIR